jgi:hypothetical protein
MKTQVVWRPHQCTSRWTEVRYLDRLWCAKCERQGYMELSKKGVAT